MVGQKPLGGVGNQDGIADIGIAGLDVGNGQIVRERAGADDFHPIIKDENADGRADKIIPVHEGIDQQFLKDPFRDFRRARRIDAISALHLVQVAHDESQGVLEEPSQRAFKILGVVIAVGMNGDPRKTDALCHELRKNQFRLFGE